MFPVKKVDAAIYKFIIDSCINLFNCVWMEASVSKTYLINHSRICKCIETLRRQQEGLSSPKKVKRKVSIINDVYTKN